MLIVLGLLGFVLIFIFLFGLEDFFQTEDELCRLSVLKRATLPSSAQSVFPLKCKTKKVCLTDGKSNDCVGSFAGEEQRTITLDRAEVTEKVEQEITEKMYDCWKMMGEGKLDLFGSMSSSLGFSDHATCVICSRIALDPSLTQQYRAEVDAVDVADYMKRTAVGDSGVSYWNYFRDEHTSSYAGVKGGRALKQDEKKKVLGVSSRGVEVAIVFSQIRTESYTGVFTRFGKLALFAGGTSAAVFGVRNTAKAVRAVLLTKIGLIVAVPAAVIGAGVVGYNIYTGQEQAGAYCGEFTNEGKTKGCSLVQVVPYTVKNINALCPHLEGSP